MIDFTNPIDPFEHVKIQKTQAIGEDEEKTQKKLLQKPVSKKIFIYLTLLKILSNSLKLFRNTKKKQRSRTNPYSSRNSIYKIFFGSFKRKRLMSKY